jgi:hypothetical protein
MLSSASHPQGGADAAAQPHGVDTVAHSENFFGTLTGSAAKTSATTVSITPDFADDTIIGFEHVFGTTHSDVIFGNAVANTLFGNAGVDLLFGYAGNDTLDGGDGVDLIVGGAGADKLSGGAGADNFGFTALTDSAVGAGKRDVITDFADGSDGITLAFDANTKVAGFQAFTYISSGFNPGNFALNTPGQLRTVATATGWYIEGNTDNDTIANFQIEVLDPNHTIVWNFSSGVDYSLLQ